MKIITFFSLLLLLVVVGCSNVNTTIYTECPECIKYDSTFEGRCHESCLNVCYEKDMGIEYLDAGRYDDTIKCECGCTTNKKQLLFSKAQKEGNVEHCQNLRTDEDINGCLFMVADYNNNYDICGNIKPTKEEISKNACYLRVAINSKNPEICKMIKNSPSELLYFERCYSMIAIQTKNSSLCAELPTESTGIYSQERCINMTLVYP